MVKNLPKKTWRDYDLFPRWRDYTICKDAQMLNSEQLKLFRDRLGELTSDRVHQIYRGNDRSRLLTNYGLGPSSIPQPFNELFFLYGNKGRAFLKTIGRETTTADK